MFKSLISSIMICGGLFFLCSKIYESIKKRTEKDLDIMKNHTRHSPESSLQKANCSRQVRRVKKLMKVGLSFNSCSGAMKAFTEDISICGAFVRCDDFVRIGARLRVEFLEEKRLPIMAAQVIWSNFGVPADKNKARGFGLKFTDVSKDVRSVLEHVISEK